MSEKDELNALTSAIIEAAIEVHRRLGPGLLESAYEAALVFEFARRGLPFERQKPLPVQYDSVALDCGYRLDFLVAAKVVVEVKAIDGLAPIHRAQLITYLKFTRCRVGLMINFNVMRLTDGICRVVNGFPD